MVNICVCVSRVWLIFVCVNCILFPGGLILTCKMKLIALN